MGGSGFDKISLYSHLWDQRRRERAYFYREEMLVLHSLTLGVGSPG